MRHLVHMRDGICIRGNFEGDITKGTFTIVTVDVERREKIYSTEIQALKKEEGRRNNEQQAQKQFRDTRAGWMLSHIIGK